MNIPSFEESWIVIISAKVFEIIFVLSALFISKGLILKEQGEKRCSQLEYVRMLS